MQVTCRFPHLPARLGVRCCFLNQRNILPEKVEKSKLCCVMCRLNLSSLSLSIHDYVYIFIYSYICVCMYIFVFVGQLSWKLDLLYALKTVSNVTWFHVHWRQIRGRKMSKGEEDLEYHVQHVRVGLIPFSFACSRQRPQAASCSCQERGEGCTWPEKWVLVPAGVLLTDLCSWRSH